MDGLGRYDAVAESGELFGRRESEVGILAELLTDPGTGTIHVGLRPLHDELAAAARPQSVITWLKKPPATGAELLGLMARGELPISHDTFRALPADRSHNYLRELLTSTGALAPYHPPIEQIERWPADILDGLDHDTAAVISRYGRWHHLRRLRGLAEHGTLSKASIYSARSKINGAIRLSQWAAAHGNTVDQLAQTELERHLADHPGGRTSEQSFVAWLRRTRTNTRVNIPWREETIPEVVVSDADRWEQINLLLHDDTIGLYARIGDLFTPLFAQPLETIVAMRAKLVANGIRPGQCRHVAMFALAGEVPAPILAKLVGIADKTAVKWAALAARDWSGYISDRAR